MNVSSLTRSLAALALCAVVLGVASPAARARGAAAPAQDIETVGVPTTGAFGVTRTTGALMAQQALAQASRAAEWRALRRELEGPDRRNLPQDPGAPSVARSSAHELVAAAGPAQRDVAQTISTSFTGATLADTGAFPPDSMGAVGPTQFFVFVNGRMRTFNKATGAADGVVNIDPDVFFSAVMTPAVINFTSDPQVRYDRLTRRWILTIIEVPSTSASTIGDTPNRILVAVSDSPSAGIIGPGTAWTLFFVQQDTVGGGPSTGEFLDYDSLGVDANALYVGGDMFGAASGSFTGTSAFVIRKSSILGAGPIVTTAFRGLITSGPTGDGPDSPRGVDNPDPAATEGYIIGVSDVAFGRLIMRRISTPGATPAISANIAITVSTTSFPITVDHLGNTGGVNGRLDALNDRLLAAHIRNGELWTAHTIAVTSLGVASGSDAQRRDAVRWYDLTVPPGTGAPVVNQSGTVFDGAATVAAARQFWMPSVTVSGQGHAALGFSSAGTPFRANAATTGRMAGDAPGTTGAVSNFTASSTAYNPPADPGPARRWGDYSFVSVDPSDDMTMWTIQEFCDATNTYGVRVVKLLAPPPATPTSSPNVGVNRPSTDVVIAGASSSGSGFFDPGPGVSNRLTAAIGGGVTVNAVTAVSATSVTLNVSTVGAAVGSYDLTMTNPDGQSVTATGAVAVSPTAPSVATGVATAIGMTGATLNGTANPNGAATNANFQYGLTSGYGLTTPAQALGSGTAAVPVPGGAVGGLTCGTLYHFQAVALNSVGPAAGSDATFTTAACPSPTVTVNPTSTALVPGRTVVFTAAATGSPSPTAQWQVSTNDGSTWTNVPGAVANSYSFTVALTDNAKQFRAVFSNSGGSATTGAATLFVRARVFARTDIDGDGLGDLAVWRATTGTWYWLTSSTAFAPAAAGLRQWGNQSLGDVPLMDDIDGDGKADLVVWRASTGTWFWLTSSSGYDYAAAGVKQWGNQSLGDVPMLADIDGDGKADLVVWRASTGTWYWVTSSTGFSYALAGSKQWGSQAAGDVPRIGDIDGDGKADLTVWRATTGTWFWLTAASGYDYAAAGNRQWGSQSAGDQPQVGDIDGDGKSDLVVWRSSTGTWFWLTSSTGFSYGTAGSTQWGSQASGDLPLLADLDGDGKSDLTFWRAPTGTWQWLPSVSGFSPLASVSKQWGSQANGDVPMIR